MKKIKKLMAASLALIMMSMTFAGCSAKNDPVVAIIEGQKIQESEFRTYLWSIQQFFEQLSGPAIWDAELQGQKAEDIAKERAMESVVLSVVTTKKAEELGIELTKEEKKEAKDGAANFIKSNPDILKTHGFGEKDVENLLKETQLSTKVQAKLGENYVPNQEELTKYLAENKAKYEKVQAKHILIKTVDDAYQPLPEAKQKEALAKAEEVLTKAKAGEDMTALATKYSQDTDANGKLNSNGEYTFGKGEMVPEFEKAAFEGKDGQVYPELVKTTYGYHIVKTEKHLAADEAKMKTDYESMAKMDFANKEIDEMTKNAKIEKTEAYNNIHIIKPAASATPGASTAPGASVAPGASATPATTPVATPAATPKATENTSK